MELRFGSEPVAALVVQTFSLQNWLAGGCECLRVLSSSTMDLAWNG
jgi:hypothetical protein